MKERTYRYFKGEVTHPFGFGLSYTSFLYSNVIAKKTKSGHTFEFTLTNTGNREGDEVVQLYLQRKNRTEEEPVKQLKKFRRIHLKPKESKQVILTLTKKDMEYWFSEIGGYTVYPGTYKIFIGSSSVDEKISCEIIHAK